MKMDLLTNATIVDDAIRFVSDKSKDRLKASSFSNSDEHQKEEPDYDEDEDQLEEEQEEETGVITTTNQIF